MKEGPSFLEEFIHSCLEAGAEGRKKAPKNWIFKSTEWCLFIPFSAHFFMEKKSLVYLKTSSEKIVKWWVLFFFVKKYFSIAWVSWGEQGIEGKVKPTWRLMMCKCWTLPFTSYVPQEPFETSRKHVSRKHHYGCSSLTWCLMTAKVIWEESVKLIVSSSWLLLICCRRQKQSDDWWSVQGAGVHGYNGGFLMDTQQNGKHMVHEALHLLSAATAWNSMECFSHPSTALQRRSREWFS